MSEQQSNERVPRQIAFVRARWHSEVVDSAYDAFVDVVSAQRGGTVEVFDVPGALEIPLHVKTLADSGRYDAVIACAFVVDGGIYRHDFVAGTVLDAIMAIQLASGLPVFSLVLTPHAFQETEEHRRFFREHFVVKGREVAAACLQTLEARARLVSG